MGFEFYLKSAWKNISNNKKQSTLYTLGIIIAITLLLSLQLWSSTAEDLAARDFLVDQDYELKVSAYLYDDLPYIKDFLENDLIVQEVSEIYYNIAFFNAEEKPVTYRFSPEDDQDDMSDPVSLTSLILLPYESIERIQSQFLVRGDFEIEENEVLISEFEAEELERIYGYEIEPGMKMNVSIAKNGPELGEVYLFNCDLEHFYNVTIRGIYRTIPTISMLQRTLPITFLKDSIIFLSENMVNHTTIMKQNGLQPEMLVKCDINELKKDGIDQILQKIEDLTSRLKIAFQSSQSLILSAPTQELEQSYSVSKTALIFAVPVVVISIILSLFTTNIVLEKRKKHVDTLKERGGEKWQIFGIILLEFLILAIIAFVISIASSFVVAALIPAFASGSFTWTAFTEFISSVIFPYSMLLYICLSVLLITGIFAIVKFNDIFDNNLEDHQKMSRARIKKIASIIAISSAFVAILALLLTFSILSFGDINEVFNFTIEETEQNMIVFLLIILLVLLFSFIASIGMQAILGKIKKVYDKLFKNNAFFIANTFKSSNSKISSILLVLIILASVNIFYLNLYATNSRNNSDEQYYNNGADFRIQTSFVDSDFIDTLNNISGIDDVMPVFSAEGKLIYNSVTVYGVDPIKYHDIGRWEIASTQNGDVETALRTLNSTHDGAIVSDVLAEKLNLTVGSVIPVTGMPNRSYIEIFNVSGIIHSAPGLGLAYGLNVEIGQSNQEYILINQRKMQNDYAVSDSNLFFAKQTEGTNFDEIVKELLELNDVLTVNPEVINEQFIGQYINLYIPKVNAFIISQIILINIIAIIIIISNLEFLLSQRKQNNAILNTIGNSTKNLLALILSELSIVNVVAIISGIIIGIPFALFSIAINRPIFTSHNILPYNFTFDYLGIPIFIIALFLISSLTILPAIHRFSKENIAIAIRN
ncbi:MAG: FtsX-like permease family protein [Candidatus Heimdallarchaeota archaeon]